MSSFSFVVGKWNFVDDDEQVVVVTVHVVIFDLGYKINKNKNSLIKNKILIKIIMNKLHIVTVFTELFITSCFLFLDKIKWVRLIVIFYLFHWHGHGMDLISFVHEITKCDELSIIDSCFLKKNENKAKTTIYLSPKYVINNY